MPKLNIDIDLDDLEVEDLRKYVHDNSNPEDVFDRDELEDYAKNEFNWDELFSESDIIEGRNPEDIFPDASLADWANRHGWKGPN